MLHSVKIDEIFNRCQEGQLSVSALEAIPDVEKLRDLDGRSLFDVALEYKRVEVAQYLFQFVDLPNDQEEFDSVMSAAVQTGQLWYVEFVFNQIPNSWQQFSGDRIYEVACMHGHLDIMRYIRQKLNHREEDAFVSTCKHGHYDVAREFFSSSRRNRLSPYSSGMYNLTCYVLQMWDSSDDIQPTFELLIEKGCVDTSTRNFWASLGRGCPTIPFIKHVLSVYDPTEDDISDALAYACENGRDRTILCLLGWCSEQESSYTTVLEANNLYDTLSSAFENIKTEKGQSDLMDVIIPKLDLDGLPVYQLNSILKMAVSCSNLAIVTTLVDEGKCDVNECSVSRYKEIYIYDPLISNASDPLVIQLLLEAKAVVSGDRFETVFRASCMKLRSDGVQALLEAGADVNMGVCSVSAVFHAIHAPCTDEQREDKVAVLKMLVLAGADLGGYVAMNECLSARNDSNRELTLRVLLPYSSTMLLRANRGETPLLRACQGYDRDPGLFRTLIDAGDNVNASSRDESSVISCLLRCHGFGNILHPFRRTRNVMQILLDAGADPFIDTDGYSVLMILIHQQSNPVIYGDAPSSILIRDILKFILYHPDLTTLDGVVHMLLDRSYGTLKKRKTYG
jgi:ankyrin repeat protein